MPTANLKQQRREAREAINDLMTAAMDAPPKNRMVRSEMVADRRANKRELRRCTAFSESNWPEHVRD
jgi:hypothetical protein